MLLWRKSIKWLRIENSFFEYIIDIPPGVDILRSHMFLKMMSNGILKARLVAGGDSLDRNVSFLPDDKSARSSPTIHMENLFLILGYTASNK